MLSDVGQFDSEYRNGLGYHQPAGALASLGVMARAAARRNPNMSPAVRRRCISRDCTQCMECITACPDTALPNSSQDVSTVLRTAATYYITDAGERTKFIGELKGWSNAPASR